LPDRRHCGSVFANGPLGDNFLGGLAQTFVQSRLELTSSANLGKKNVAPPFTGGDGLVEEFEFLAAFSE